MTCSYSVDEGRFQCVWFVCAIPSVSSPQTRPGLFTAIGFLEAQHDEMDFPSPSGLPAYLAEWRKCPAYHRTYRLAGRPPKTQDLRPRPLPWRSVSVTGTDTEFSPSLFRKRFRLLLPEPSRAGGIGSNGSLPASWETAPPAADRLRSGPAGPGADDSNPGDNELCVDSGWASLGAFCGVFTPEGRPCRSQAPRHGRSAASVPSWDKIPNLSFVESSMTRLESCPTNRPWLTSGVGSPLSPPAQPPDLTSHLSSVIRHLSSAIRHLSSAISPFPVPKSAFRIF